MQGILLYIKCLVAVEAISALTGLVTKSKWQHSYLKWFPLYLTLITVIELCNRTLGYFHKNEIASIFEQVAVPVEILFINWFFYKTLSGSGKKLVLTGTCIYIATWIYENTLFNATGYYFKSLSTSVGNLFILIYIVLFFITLVKSDKILRLKQLTVFWIVLGMLVFYLGTFPFYGLYNELAKKENLHIFYPAAWVATSLNYCMYLLFTIGFIWGKPH